jgi:hypothetical protein
VRGIRWSYVIVAAVLVAVGGWFVNVGVSSRPHDDAEAKVFRTDPSCTDTAAGAVRGACAWEPVTVVSAQIRVRGTLHHRSRRPYASVRLANGSVVERQLDGSAGMRFAETVRPGSAGQAQFYRARLVRIAAGGLTAETTSAPDVAASTDVQMAWIGGGMIVLAGVVMVAGVRRPKRAAIRVRRV